MVFDPDETLESEKMVADVLFEIFAILHVLFTFGGDSSNPGGESSTFVEGLPVIQKTLCKESFKIRQKLFLRMHSCLNPSILYQFIGFPIFKGCFTLELILPTMENVASDILYDDIDVGKSFTSNEKPIGTLYTEK
jgi:hypothetical protein